LQIERLVNDSTTDAAVMEWKQNLLNATRAVLIQITNNTHDTLLRGAHSAESGTWSLFPPEKILPGTTVEFGTHSSKFMSGMSWMLLLSRLISRHRRTSLLQLLRTFGVQVLLGKQLLDFHYCQRRATQQALQYQAVRCHFFFFFWQVLVLLTAFIICIAILLAVFLTLSVAASQLPLRRMERERAEGGDCQGRQEGQQDQRQPRTR
jgi:hypothetical protein